MNRHVELMAGLHGSMTREATAATNERGLAPIHAAAAALVVAVEVAEEHMGSRAAAIAWLRQAAAVLEMGDRLEHPLGQ